MFGKSSDHLSTSRWTLSDWVGNHVYAPLLDPCCAYLAAVLTELASTPARTDPVKQPMRESDDLISQPQVYPTRHDIVLANASMAVLKAYNRTFGVLNNEAKNKKNKCS